jgi:hypothetical protein
MTDGIRIRQMEHDDIDDVLVLCEEMITESKYHGLVPFDRSSTIMMLADSVDGMQSKTFVLVDNQNAIVGGAIYAIMPYFFARRILAVDLAVYVTPKHRTYRAVKMLITAGEQWSRDNQAGALMLGITAPEDDELVAKLYGKLGYRHWGTLMRKELV